MVHIAVVLILCLSHYVASMFCVLCQYLELFNFRFGWEFNLSQVSDIKFKFFQFYVEKKIYFDFICKLEFSFLCLKELFQLSLFPLSFFF